MDARGAARRDRHRPSLFEPGTQFRYSNTNYLILGVLIEEITGQPYHEVVRRRIIEPLDLAATYLDGFEEVPAPFDPYGGSDPSAPDEQYDSTSITTAAWAAGAIVSSAEDLHRLCAALFDDRIISAASVAEMTAGGEYGLGVELSDWPRGLVGHGGAISGYGTFVRHSVDTGTTAFFAATDLGFNPISAIVAVLDAVVDAGR
ncbi:MAG: serine hydrolase domain-containing protein [Ilumatobacter sp.]|uniref:serine hydrolase domain-containing protein n=1 Tax=Ilumatobacter sp. TaxID=1967498 RepID=UPI002610A0D7|nr:serine hydrolase domain-containing protein [Ilumatobacter sp.]MDJ0771754.1 serine hydrolase domain-containing protein [Ilumatobacter sp.]